MNDGPVLDGLNLVVGDMETTVRFYRDLGISIPDDSIWRTASGPHHVTVKLPGGADLDLDSHELARVYNAGWEGSGSPGVIGFRVATRDTVDSTYKRLVTAGHRGLQEPWDAFWGARYAIVEDPDGRHVGLMSPSDPKRRTAPPSI